MRSPFLEPRIVGEWRQASIGERGDASVIVFEVLSDSTSQTGRIDKNREYRATPSIQRYIVLQQTRMVAIVFHRRGQDCLSEIVSGPDATLDLPEIGIEVPLRQVYVNVGLSEAAAA